jgi:hypothetical protein
MFRIARRGLGQIPGWDISVLGPDIKMILFNLFRMNDIYKSAHFLVEKNSFRYWDARRNA